jgi:hypothetical protein
LYVDFFCVVVAYNDGMEGVPFNATVGSRNILNRCRIPLRMDGDTEMALNKKQVVDTAERGVIYTVVRTVVRAVISALFRG